MTAAVIPRRTVLCLGVTLLVSWGVSYYLVGVFGRRIADAFGWSLAFVNGGYTAALLVMAALSPAAGRWIDRWGGRWVMAAGATLTALACALLAAAQGPVVYYAAWIVMGVAMRLTLYDAAFAALARVGGAQARAAIAQVTLFGGLASTVFWPLGDALANAVGWRAAVLVYGAISLCCIPLYLTLPPARGADGRSAPQAAAAPAPRARTPRERALAGGLYAASFALGHALGSAMAAHLLTLLAGLGVGAALVVWIGTLRGIGQIVGRLSQIVIADRASPLAVNVAAAALMPLAFLLALATSGSAPAAIAFVLLFGAAYGVLAITQGTLPLILFDLRTYGEVSGRLLVPSFVLSSLSPILFAHVIETWGAGAALGLSLAMALAALACAATLAALFGERRG